MFKFSTARNHMIESQIRTNDVTDLSVISAFRKIERENFVPKSRAALAYSDSHVQIDADRWLARPRDFSKLIQATNIGPQDIVLDIGCGRGYSTAMKELENAGITNAAVVKGELKAGASEHGPFDVIFINGSVSDIAKSWLDQLSNNGRLVCVKQNGPIGHATIFTRVGDSVGERILFDATIPALPGFEAKEEFAF